MIESLIDQLLRVDCLLMAIVVGCSIDIVGICLKLIRAHWCQTKNNFSKFKIPKNFGLFPSTILILYLERFRESGGKI